MKTRIVFNLKREWFDKIKSGEKTVEYRESKDYWWRRLSTPKIVDGKVIARKLRPLRYRFAEFRCGYTKCGAIVRKIKDIDVGPCPYPGWSGEYLRIHFTKGSNS